MKKFKKLLADNLWLFKICYKAAPAYMICYIVEAIRNELVVFLEFTLALNFVLECSEFGRPFEVASTFLLALLAFVVLGLLFNAFLYQKLQQKAQPKIKQAIKQMMFDKATLIKLIMRLYDPNEGEILLDGVNIKEYDVEEYRRKIGTVFQDFKIFAATVKENVLLDFAEKGNDEDVVKAIEKSGFAERLETLEQGLKTNLTTEFEEDGVNLSGGEGQKLAVARVFYKDANLIILDEPSSALDPIAEYHLNHSMLTAAENKSVVFISHRLSTTRIADRIYMLEKGRIIEEGSHAELLSRKGKYAEMWRVQAGQYLA